MFVLYQITNMVNGKYYIGAHACSDEHTCFANGMCTYMGSGTHISRAVKKYGFENFKKDILAEVSSEDLLYKLEAAVVDEAFVSRNDTYNHRAGGHGGRHSEDAKRRMSESHRGMRHSTESKRKMSLTRKGMSHGPHSAEAKRNMSFAKKGKPLTAEHRHHLSVAMKGNPAVMGANHWRARRSQSAATGVV